MKRTLACLVVWATLLVLPLALPAGVAAQDEMAKTTLKVGDLAPDFSLPSDQGGIVKLSDFRGKKAVVLAFYVLAFTGG